MTNKLHDDTTAAEIEEELAATLDGPNDALDVLADEPEHGHVAAPLAAEMLERIIEGALLASGQPLNMVRILGLFEEAEMPAKEDVLAALERIAAACEGRGFELKEVASGWRFQVRQENARWVNRLFDEKPQRYSRALLETLALIAYRQPITRGDIEEIRGVAVSSHIMKTLIEREWVKVVGHRDVPGRPSLYATTRQFLDYFNLHSLDQLPTLGEISDLESLNPELELGLPESQNNQTAEDLDELPAEAESSVADDDTSEPGQSIEVSADDDNASDDDLIDNNDIVEADTIEADTTETDATETGALETDTIDDAMDSDMIDEVDQTVGARVENTESTQTEVDSDQAADARQAHPEETSQSKSAGKTDDYRDSNSLFNE